MTSTSITSTGHGEGNTRLCFSKDGKKLYSGGTDCLVRIWPASLASKQEPKAVDEAEESITTLASFRDGWVSGSSDSTVRRYSATEDMLEGLVTQTNAAPVRCLALHPEGNKLAVGSDELTVRIINLENTLECSILFGHKSGLRAASWHPSGKILTTTGQDGKIVVWDCSEAEPVQSKVLDGLVPASSDPTAVGFFFEASAVWHPLGAYFVVAAKSHDIAIVSRSTWTKSGSFSNNGHSSVGDITALGFSPNGLYLASAGKDGQVIVWRSGTQEALYRQQPNGGAILSMAFSPTANLLAWSNLDGNVGRWTDPIPSSQPAPFSAVVNTAPKVKEKQKLSEPKLPDPKLQALLEDDDAEMGESTEPRAEDEAEEEEAEEEEDWVENDLPEVYAAQKDTALFSGAREMVNVTKAQPAFQPGSTPFRNKKRYLAFNSIGVIEVSDQDIHHVVNIDFHDKSLRRGYHFQDVFRFSMASLGERGILFASVSEEKTSAVISYKPFESWASDADWQISLPKGEDPVCVAAGGAPYSKFVDKTDVSGNGHLAVATTKGYVRFFSGGGCQLYVWNIGGEVVSMAAGQEWAFVIHREGGTSLDGCQNLRYSLIAFDSFDVLQAGPIPLPRGTTLEWIGITEEGAPTMYTSAGLISILDRFRRPTQGRWVPILDTTTLARKVGKQESYWAVGLSGKELQCVILKGSEKFPGFPRPLIQEIEAQMPLLNLDNPQGKGEEKFLRGSIQTTILRDAAGKTSSQLTDVAKKELEMDKELVQLIGLACKADKLQRALDLTRMLHHAASYDSAQKVAGFYHFAGLQEKIGLLKEQKLARDNSDSDDEERNPRKNWGKVSEPIGRSGGGHVNGRSGMNGSRFADGFAPPPVTTRRTLAPAIPVGEVAFCRPGAPPPAFSQFTDTSTMDVDSSFNFSDVDVGKRKRDDESERDLGDGAESWDMAGPSTKKRSNGTTNVQDVPQDHLAAIAAPKTTTNPFAKKPAGEKAANPFAKKNTTTSKALEKSNTFFQKVDAAEAAGASGKKSGKEKVPKEPKVRQTTLFGLPTVPVEKKPKGKKGKGKEADASPDDSSEPASKNRSTEDDETQESPADGDDQSPMVNGDAETQLETQLEETQLESDRGGSPEWDVDMGDEAQEL